MRMLRPTGGRACRGRARAASGCDGDTRPDLGHDRRARCSRRRAAPATGIRPARATHLTYDAADDVWQGTFALPAGSYEYKAALNNAWDENYGLHAVARTARNIPTTLASAGSVKFYYDHKTHWATDNKSSVIAVAAGSFQSELGCPGDWDPDCLRSWLEDPDGNGIYSFETTALPAGSYETKVTINEDWDENYGLGGALNGANIPFSVPVDNAKVTFTYDATHARAHDPRREPERRARRPRRALALRPRAEGLPRHGPQHDLEGLVHGRERRAQRHLLPDGRQHERRDAPVRRQRRLDVHRPPDARHDLRRWRRCRRQRRDGVQGDGDGEERQVPRSRPTYITDPDRNTVVMRVEFKPKHEGPDLRLYVRLDPTVNGNGGGGAGNGGADSATVDGSTGHPVLVSSDPVTATNAANRDYAQPVYAALDGSFSEAESGFVGAASDGLVQLDATHALTPTYPDAEGGNVVQTAQVALDERRQDGADARLRRDAGRGGRRGRGLARRRASTSAAGRATARAGGRYDKSLNKPPKKLTGLKARSRSTSSRTSTT